MTKQIALLALLALALGLATAGFSFVWDDPYLIELNPAVTGPLSSGRAFTSPLVLKSGPTSFYRPLQILSHALEYRVFGLDPRGYHIVNALLHTGVVILVYLSGCLLAPAGGAFAGAVLFALHPIHAEPVAFISARGDLLAAIFALLAFLFADTAARSRSYGRLAGAAAAAGVAFMVSLFSKESGALVPFALLVWVMGRPAGDLPLPRRRVIAVLAASLGVGLAVYAIVRVTTLPGSFLPAGGALDPGGALRRFALYVRLLLDPSAILAGSPPRPAGWGLGSLAGAAALALLVAAAVAPGHRRRDRVFLCSWFLLTLAPALKIVFFPGSDVASRYLYLPSLALSWGLATLWPTARLGLERIHPAAARLLPPAAAVALIPLWYHEASSWRSEMSLYSRMVREEPASELVRYNLANTLFKAGRREEAIEQLLLAVKLRPDYPSARYNLGRYLAESNRGAEAIEHLEAYLRLRPDAPDAPFARAYLQQLRRGAQPPVPRRTEDAER